MFFVEEIVVMGTYIEVYSHIVDDESHGRVILQQVVDNIVDDKWKVRLVKVTISGMEVVEEKDSYSDDE